MISKDIIIEKQLNDLKQFEAEKERLIAIAAEMRDEYQKKIDVYYEELRTKRLYVNTVIKSMLSPDEMNETKIQYSLQLPSGKIVINKDKKVMKLKEEYNENFIPEKFIEVKRKVKWGEYKKILKISGDKVINTVTGEIVPDVEIIKLEGGQVSLKLYGDES